ncbi:MAG: hypothetical protein RR792_08200 [Thermomonas sp.]
MVALVVLFLAGGAAWWWRSNNLKPAQQAGAVPVSAPDASVAVVPSPASRRRAVTDADDATKRCGMAIRDAFNVRALQLKNMEDSASQLAYALAVPVAPSMNWEALAPEAQRRAMEQRHEEAQRALLRAVELSPKDPEVLWFASGQCASGDRCDAARQALLQAEPGNMLVWLREMARASQRDDAAAAGLAFQRAASAPAYDAHGSVIQRVMFNAYGTLSLPLSCVDEGVQDAMQREMRIDLGRPFGVFDHAMLMAVAGAPTMALSPLRQHCMPHAGMDSVRRSACRSVLTRLAGGDIWIERMIALDVLVQLLGDDPEAAAWRERYRENRWMMTQLADSKIQALLLPEDYWNDEARSIQAALQIAGRWPPPADWLPDDEHARSLILTGRPPPEKKPDQGGVR